MNWYADTLNFLALNLGIGFSDLILIVTVFAGFILCAKDFKIGLMSYLILFSLEFIVFYNFGMEIGKVLFLIFIVFILMSLSLYTSSSKSVVT